MRCLSSSGGFGYEIQATLLSPLSVTLLLDILACLGWVLWLIFAVDVARCVPHALRGIRPPAAGPLHALAGVLLAAIALGLLGPRSPTPREAPIAAYLDAVPVATQTYHSPARATGFVRLVDELPQAPVQPGTVIVQPPHAGVHDSLWRIAERALGDGDRWPELFHANQGRPQPDGDTLTNPHFIRPGWVLTLPDPPPATAEQPPATVEQSSSPQPVPIAPPSPETPPPTTPPSTTRPPVTPSPTRHLTPAPAPAPARGHGGSVTVTGGGGIVLAGGGFLALSLASAVAAALVLRRRRRLRRYLPGSGDREQPPPLAPIVHALRIAHDQHDLGLSNDNDDADDSMGVGEVIVTERDIEPVDIEPELEPAPSFEPSVEIGVRDGRAQAVDLAALRGLGLTGAGAHACARALLVHLLATTTATVVMPEHDALALLGGELPTSARLRITTDLDAAITDLNGHLDSDTHDQPVSVVVATVDTPQDAGLQSLLDNGSSHGVTGVLLGHWPAGATRRIRGDGIVTAASPTHDHDLRGARLFHLDAADTRDLLDLFATEPDTPTLEEPGPPAASLVEPASDAAGLGDRDDDPAPKGEEDDPRCPEVCESSTAVPLEAPEPAVTQPTTEDEVLETFSAEPSTEDDEPSAAEAVSERALALTVFGPPTLTWTTPGEVRDLTPQFAPKHIALLVLLALYPEGTSRDVVRDALWPTNTGTGKRPYNAFYATLSQVRKILSRATDGQVADLIDQHGDHIAVNGDRVEVDYWDFHDADHAARTATSDEQRLAAYSRIAAVYRGRLADGLSALWLDTPAEHAHRTVLDALSGMAASCRGSDPQRQLALLEHARMLNPDNEAIYREIMTAQAELGLTDAIGRTLHLLTTTLADLGAHPDPATVNLARTLQHREHRRVAS